MPINERDAIFKIVAEEFSDNEIDRSINALERLQLGHQISSAEIRDLEYLKKLKKERANVRTS
jgi:hypothetical protein